MTKPANHNKRWTDVDDHQLILAYAKGVPIDAIAANFGRTAVSILYRLSTYELVKFVRNENAYFTVPTKLYQF